MNNVFLLFFFFLWLLSSILANTLMMNNIHRASQRISLLGKHLSLDFPLWDWDHGVPISFKIQMAKVCSSSMLHLLLKWMTAVDTGASGASRRRRQRIAGKMNILALAAHGEQQALMQRETRQSHQGTVIKQGRAPAPIPARLRTTQTSI